MPRKNARHGIAIVMVLVLIVLVSLGAYTFTEKMTAYQKSVVMTGRQAQARAAVASGVEYIKDYLAMLPEDQAAIGGHWDNLSYFQNVAVSEEDINTARFSIISITQDEFGEPTGIRYGLTDEGSKININQLATSDLYGDQGSGNEDRDEQPEEGEEEGGEGDGEGEGGGDQEESAPAPEGEGEEEDPLSVDPRQNVLMQLPNMTEVIADSILDWIDSDSTPRAAGAEADMYSAVVGYEPPNGPLASLDELLLVQGVTPELLYGADRNHNGILDENEQAAAASTGDINGSMARGWSAYLTVHSKDTLYQVPDVEPIDLNSEDLELLYEDLIGAGFDEDFANFVIFYRQNGPYTMPEIPEDAPEDFELPQPEPVDGREADLTKGAEKEFGSVLDVIGSFVEIEVPSEGGGEQQQGGGGQSGRQSGGEPQPGGGGEPQPGGGEQPQGGGEQQTEKVVLSSPYAADSDLSAVLPELMTNLTAGDRGGTGRVNTNHCPGSIVSGIPGVEPESVQSIIFSQDPGGASGDINYLFPTWPLATGAVTLEEMKAMLPFVSGQGQVFRAQVVGYSDVPGVYARAEVVIDASGDAPKVLSWRDLSHLGPGFTVDTLSTQ